MKPIPESVVRCFYARQMSRWVDATKIDRKSWHTYRGQRYIGAVYIFAYKAVLSSERPTLSAWDGFDWCNLK